MRSNSLTPPAGAKEGKMAKYRLIKKGVDSYMVVGLFTPSKGGATKLVKVDAKLVDLGEKAQEVAENVGRLRKPNKPAQDGASEPKGVEV